MAYAVKTYYGIWLKRAQRLGQREYRKMYGWLDRTMADVNVLTADVCVPTEKKHGYETREEADSAVLLLASRNPWALGWLEVRPFCGYCDQHGNWTATWCGANR